MVAAYMGDTRAALRKNPEDAILRARAFEAPPRALGPLDEEERQLIALRYWASIPWPEIALAMGQGERRVKRMDERLRARLGRDLRKRGIEEAPPSA